MRKLQVKIQTLVSFALAIAITLNGLAIPVFSQQPKPIVITFGQPNIWSLEQAHYLLARMHRQNLDLQTATLGDLDPNATNASRIDILKTLLEAGVKFDQAVGLNNQLLRDDKEFNSGRRQELLANRSSLQGESTQLARDIATLKIAKANAKTDEERAPIQAAIEAKTDEKAAVDNQLTQVNSELQGLTPASGNFTSVEAPGTFNSDRLKGDLDSLINRVQLINPSIAATLRLDNHIQMQYEIIAKQLTLLRDEVGPGERLVFLELPQSINATQDRAENKIAQTWWRIAGYTRVNRKALMEQEVSSLLSRIQDLQTDVDKDAVLYQKNQTNRALLNRRLDALCEERALRKTQFEKESCSVIPFDMKQLEKEIEDLKAQIKTERDQRTRDDLTARLNEACERKEREIRNQELESCSKITKNILQLDNAIKQMKIAIQKIDDQEGRLQEERAKIAQAFTTLTTKLEKLKVELLKNSMREERDAADRILQGGGARTSDIIRSTFDLLNTNQSTGFSNKIVAQPGLQGVADAQNGFGREYVGLGMSSMSNPDLNTKFFATSAAHPAAPVWRNRAVRTIDIIPRQSAINVNDTKQRVSKTGIFAAVSFLFGFAGKFGYERQHEQAQQFINQELFTSGFGKGEPDFGWNFYPFAGTKQLASGIRTTFAVAIIPDNAESLVLKAKGCYFSRKENQPQDYDQAAEGEWTNGTAKNCTAPEQMFVLPVPGGSGDGSDYYVTGIWYGTNLEPGERMVASIYAQNLPSQIGVLVEGVALRQSVGLGQLNVESILGDRIRENCDGEICGRFERVDSNQIVISFKMPAAFTGIPRISLIGPGKALELNKLNLTVNGEEDSQLDAAEPMFGNRPSSTLRKIADFKVAPVQGNPDKMTGVLSGGRFKSDDKIYVNGVLAPPVPTTCREDLCIVTFDRQSTDFLTVTISPADAKDKAVSRTVVNPTSLSIISASVVSNQPGDATRPAVLTVKLDGSGFKETLEVKIIKADGPSQTPQMIVPSAGQMILKVVSPEAVVQITLRDPDNNKMVSAVVVKPADPPKEKSN